jgi:hypothetical protein
MHMYTKFLYTNINLDATLKWFYFNVISGKVCAGPSGVTGRSRQYSWPSDGSTCPPGSGKNRKKEQNRIASQRFRERRRRLMSRFQEEAEFYQVIIF